MPALRFLPYPARTAAPSPEGTHRARTSAFVAFQIAAPVVLTASLLSAPPAHAQVAGALSIQSDYRVRGYSFSGNKPAATLILSFDDISGIYANGSVTGSIGRDDQPAVIGALANIGYAHRIAPKVSLDGGIVHTRYFRGFYASANNVHTNEVYLGAIVHGVGYHVHYSPDYFGTGVSTLYHEAAGGVAVVGDLQLTGRVGLISYLDAPSEWRLKDDVNWSVGLAKPVGRFTLSLSVDGGKSRLLQFYQGKPLGGTKLIGTITWAF